MSPPEEEMGSLIKRFLADRSGATAIEYAMVAGIISMAIVAAVSAIGTKLNTKYSAASAGLN